MFKVDYIEYKHIFVYIQNIHYNLPNIIISENSIVQTMLVYLSKRGSVVFIS